MAVLAGPSRLVAGRISPLPSAALRPGGVGLTSTSARSLLGSGTEDTAGTGGAGSRVRVRRLSDTSVTILAASCLNLVLEASAGVGGGGSGGGQQGSLSSLSSPNAYLERLAPGRMALLKRAVGYCARGVHVREGDLLSVSFEGVPHSFRVSKVEPPAPIPTGSRRETATDAAVERMQEAGGGCGGDDSLVKPLAELSIFEPPIGVQSPPSKTVAAATSSALTAAAAEGADASATAEPTPSRSTEPDDGGSTEESTENGTAAGGAARLRLEAFYRAHNPEKLVGGDVDGILAKYAGREETLFAKLEKKYGSGSSLLRTTTAGGNTGTERLRQGHQQQPPSSVATRSSAAADAASFSPFRGESPLPPNGIDRNQAGALHSPAMSSAKRRNAESVSGSGAAVGDEAAGIRSWGAGESLWLVSAETSIQLSGAVATEESTHTTDNYPVKEKSWDGGGPPPEAGEGGDWGSVGGLSSQIQQLREAIELPLRSPEVLQRYGVRPPRGVLLHGPPGTGKTTLARAAAKACGCHVIVVNGSELMSR